MQARELDHDVPAGFDEAARVLDQVRERLLQAVGVAEHVGCLADDLHVGSALLEDGMQRVHDALRQLPQVHAAQLVGPRGRALDALQREQVVDEPRKALGFSHDDRRELLAHGRRQVGVLEHLGVPPDGGERGAQLVRDVAHELALPPALAHEVALLRLELAHEDVHGIGKLVGLVEPPVGLEVDGHARAVRPGLAEQEPQRLGKEVPDDKAEHERDERAGHEQEERVPRQRIQQRAHEQDQGARQYGEQRRQEREVCLESPYCLNLYP